MSFSTKVASYGLIYMLGSMEFGFILNFGGLAIEGLKKSYPSWDSSRDDLLIKFFGNFASLFGCLGGFLVRYLVRFFGSRKTICGYNIINFTLWLMYFTFTPKRIVVGIVLQSLQGVLTAGLACLTPIQMTSISPEDTVGMLGCFNQIGIVFGMIVFSIVGTFCSYKVLMIIAAVVDVVQAGAIFIVPCNKSEKEKKDTIFQKKYIRGIAVVLMLMFFQQFCGINAINENLTTIMAETGISIDKNLQAALASLSQFVSVLIAAFNMDGIGRKKMFIFSAFLIIISQIFYILTLKLQATGWLKATAVFLYLLSFGQGFGPIPWFICHDIFPKSICLDGQMLVTFVNMICSFCITFLFPVMKENIDEYLIMIIFMCITVCSIPFSWVFMPKKNDQNDDNLTLI